MFVQGHIYQLDDKGADVNYYRTLNYGLNKTIPKQTKTRKKKLTNQNVKLKKKNLNK